MTTFQQRLKVRAIWAEHCANLDKFKATAWKLLSHPDLTPEQLEDIRVRAIHVEQSHREITRLIREKGFNV